MMIVFFLILGLGVVACDWAVLANASRAGAREAIRDATTSTCSGSGYCDCASTPPGDPIWCAAYAAWQGSLLTWNPSSTPPVVTVSKPDATPGADVSVQVSYTVDFAIPWLRDLGLNLKPTTHMRMLPH